MILEPLLSWSDPIVLLLSLTATALSALITLQAYRGYRRHGSRPMLFLAVGFAFITVLPFFVDVVFNAFYARHVGARIASLVLPVVRYGLQIVGLSFVLYSLYGRRGGADTAPAAD